MFQHIVWETYDKIFSICNVVSLLANLLYVWRGNLNKYGLEIMSALWQKYTNNNNSLCMPIIVKVFKYLHGKSYAYFYHYGKGNNFNNQLGTCTLPPMASLAPLEGTGEFLLQCYTIIFFQPWYLILTFKVLGRCWSIQIIA